MLFTDLRWCSLFKGGGWSVVTIMLSTLYTRAYVACRSSVLLGLFLLLFNDKCDKSLASHELKWKILFIS